MVVRLDVVVCDSVLTCLDVLDERDSMASRRRLAIGPFGTPGCNTTRPCPVAGPAAMIDRCRESQGVIVVLDQAQAHHRDLAAAVLRCPGCAGSLRQWGFARARSLRLPRGGRTWPRPRRARCASCAVTHVLLSAQAPARHAYAIDVMGQALLASARGQGHRKIGAELTVPADTVRGWIRRATGRAEWLRAQGTIGAHEFDPMRPVPTVPTVPTDPTGSALADALSALGLAAAAVVRRLGQVAPTWHIIAMLARGRLSRRSAAAEHSTAGAAMPGRWRQPDDQPTA